MGKEILRDEMVEDPDEGYYRVNIRIEGNLVGTCRLPGCKERMEVYRKTDYFGYPAFAWTIKDQEAFKRQQKEE